MKYKIIFKLEQDSDTISSLAKGYITAENFEEMAEEIERWFERPNTTCTIERVDCE